MARLPDPATTGSGGRGATGTQGLSSVAGGGANDAATVSRSSAVS